MLARGPAKAEKHLTKRFLQGALPALLGFGLVLFAAHTAIDAYHSFRQLEGSRSSNLILASRSILDQSNVLELSRRKFSDGMGTIAAIDEAELRENLLQLVLNVSRSRRSLGADPVLREQFELRTRDLLAEARALIAYLDQVDCALMVAAAEESTLTEIEKCGADLGKRTQVLGVVLNKCRYMEEDETRAYPE